MRIFASMHIAKTAGTAFARLLIDSVSHQFPLFFLYGTGHPLTGIWVAGTQLNVGPTASEGQLAEKFIQHLGENQAGIIQAHWTVHSWFVLSFPGWVDFEITRFRKKTKNLPGKCPPPDSDPFNGFQI
jgi:hypothetical protein